MAILVESVGPDGGRKYALGSAECVLGRQAECDIHEVFSGDQRVSRRHTRIVRVHDVYYVEDLGSRNGTVVNGSRIAARAPLQDGDRIGICGIEFTFFHDRPEPRAPSSSIRRKAADSAELVDERESSSIVATARVSLSGKDTVGPELDAERKLGALLDMLSNLGNSLDVDVVLDSLLDGLFRVFPNADRAFVGLREETGDSVVPRAVRIQHGPADERMTISRTIVRQVMDSGQAILCSDAQADSRFRASQSIYVADIRSFMCAPLIDALGNGDTLILITDGITEATRPDAEMYGNKRLRDQIERAAGNAEEIGRAILRDVASFSDGHPQSDDTCLIRVRRAE